MKKVQGHIAPMFIHSWASVYNDPNRIFMEYIDNSLDSAEDFYDATLNEYSKPIKITFRIEGDNYKNGKAIISDNCSGIKDLTSVIQNIGNSPKREQPWTNGQFGAGMCSFIAACETLEIISKHGSKDALRLSLKRETFKAKKQKDFLFDEPAKTKSLNHSGTTITLTNFDKNIWNEIEIQNIKIEIEKHFELILSRKNLEVKIINTEKKEQVCQPFDYSSFEGDTWNDQITSLNTLKGRRFQQEIQLDLESPISVFLKITKGKTIGKNPVFIIKGRRIAEVREVKSFRTNHRGDIWAHPNLTGYVDLGGFLEPTISRNDFKNTPKSKAVFEKLLELEELILEFLKDINKKSDERHYKELEDELNKALAKLARIDNMNFRTEILRGNNSSGFKNDSGFSDEGLEVEIATAKQVFVDGPGGAESFPSRPPKLERDEEGEFEDEIDGKKSNDNNNPTANENDNPFDDSNVNSGERKKSGFNIEISEMEPDIDNESKEQLRSSLIGGTIRIFRKHPDFVKRADKKRTGESLITQRLITYLAGEITVHYKDKFVTKEGQPDYNKRMFSSVVDFIYRFEDSLSGLSGKNLGDFINGNN